MQILIVTPEQTGKVGGNNRTAERWREIFDELGHRAKVRAEYAGARTDLLVALHAGRSHSSIGAFRRQLPGRPVIVALTGTDLYVDLVHDQAVTASLDWATRLVLLQRLAMAQLPVRFRAKARVIYQSAKSLPPEEGAERSAREFRVGVVANLRAIKDPLRAARAARNLPADSRVRVTLVGKELERGLAAEAREEELANPRFAWRGPLSYDETLRFIAGCDLIAITSQVEGSSNVLSEALAAGVPVVASKIPGLVGTLGETFPGYYAYGDTAELTAQLSRAERDQAFYEELKRSCAAKRVLVDPQTEREAWAALLEEIARGDSDTDGDLEAGGTAEV